MKKNILIIGSVMILLAGVLAFAYRKELHMIYVSFHAFQDKNLSHTFQHMYEIQPRKLVNRGASVFPFKKNLKDLPEVFSYKGEAHDIESFLEDTKTSGLLVLQDDAILYEDYRLGSDDNTLFSSNSMGKSVVSALVGIAVKEGFIEDIDDPIGRYIPELKHTELADIPIKACLQMASGIDFDEDKDMSSYSMSTLLGMSSMKLIGKAGVKEAPYTHRRYLSINTEILGEILVRTTGRGLADYLEEKIWKKIGAEHDAYWTLNNGKELAMGGLCISLRDYARFARLYLNNGSFEGEQIIPADWIRDSVDIQSDYAKPGANDDAYNAIGYGYQWWVPEGNEGEFMAIGVYSQWIYVNPAKHIIIVKTGADPEFDDTAYELEHVEFFRAVASYISNE